MKIDNPPTPVQNPVSVLNRVWIIEDDQPDRDWLRDGLSWAADSAGWQRPHDIRVAESGAAWIERVEKEGPLGANDFIVADGMIGLDPTGGAQMVRAWLGKQRYPRGGAPRLIMVSGQEYRKMRCAFGAGTYAAVRLAKPRDRKSPVFKEIFAKFLAGSLDPLIDLGHGAVDVFDEAPNTFLTSLIAALGEDAAGRVALGVSDGDDFQQGPLAALETALAEVFKSAWAGRVDPSDHVAVTTLRRVVRVGTPGDWLPSLVTHAFQLQQAELSDADETLLRHVGIQVNYTWADLSTILTRAGGAGARRLRADDLLPTQRWVVARSDDPLKVALRHGQAQWKLSPSREPLVVLWLLMDLARSELCATLDQGLGIGGTLTFPFSKLTNHADRVIGEGWIKSVLNRRKEARGAGARVFGRIPEALNWSKGLLTALQFDEAKVLSKEEKFVVPVSWAYSDVREALARAR